MRSRFLHFLRRFAPVSVDGSTRFIAGNTRFIAGNTRWVGLAWCLLPLVVVVSGCGGCGGSSTQVVVQHDKSAQNLQQIAAAYSQAAQKLGHPPREAKDLEEILKAGPGNPDPATVLRSPDDNENYVIVWGVDFREVAKARGNVDVIIAYEQKGKGGKRHVVKPPAQVMVLTNEQFQSAAFPPGHTPGSAAAAPP
jgi:hypothetical protein